MYSLETLNSPTYGLGRPMAVLNTVRKIIVSYSIKVDVCSSRFITTMCFTHLPLRGIIFMYKKDSHEINVVVGQKGPQPFAGARRKGA